MGNYYIIDDVWRFIKTFLFHDIRVHGKHLKITEKNVCLYNEVVKSVPVIQSPRSGPKIIYNSATKKFRIAKFLYHGIQLKNGARPVPLYNTIIEYISTESFIPNRISLYGSDLTTKNTIKWYYHQNMQNVISKLA